MPPRSRSPSGTVAPVASGKSREEALKDLATRSLALGEDEPVVFACRPAKAPRFALYFVTLGLYEFWRRANLYALTDRRAAERAGLITNTEASLPLFYVQDATLRTFLWWGYIYVSTAGGEGGEMATRWLPRTDAEKFRRLILEAAHAARLPATEVVRKAPV